MDVNLKCIDEQAATNCADFLRGKGITHVIRQDDRVLTAITPTSVLRLADDALENGWAHDADCAAIIAAMG